MKKVICVIMTFIIAAVFAGCGTDNTRKTESNAENTTGAAEITDANTDIDVDLAKLSSTMVYAEVSNMTSKPDEYIGKTVKMSGAFSFYHNEQTDKRYFACVIADATACCSQGLEFVLSGEHNYPDDYPEPGTNITVTGTFNTYSENGYTYCQLINARLAS